MRAARACIVVASVFGATAFLAASFDRATAQSTPTRGKPVLELFTSQGCSSCPPADALLGQYAKRQEVIALTLPVDYWDYLGWKDTLASPAYSARQRAYSKTRGDNMVYTPQLVVNGLLHVNGAHKSDIEAAIIATKKQLEKQRVAMTVTSEGDTLKIEIGQSAGTDGNGIVWLVTVKDSVAVAIGRGENSGKRITYYNVVRNMTPVGRWSGETTTLKLPLPRAQADANGWVVLLQQGESGAIIAAADHK